MPQRQRTREESEELVAKFTRASAELSDQEAAREHAEQRVEKFLKWAYAFGLFIAGIAGWQTKIQLDVARHETEIVALKAKQEAAHDLLNDLQNTIRTNKGDRERDVQAIRADVEHLKADAGKVAEMWFMKEHGISNKEAYQQRTGQPAPKLSE